MKKLLTGILGIVILLSATSNSFAGLTKEHTRGKVISVDFTKHEVVILDDYSKTEVKYSAKTIDPGVAIGVRVMVVYKPGTNQATLVKPTKR